MSSDPPVFDLKSTILFVDDEPLCLQCFASIVGQEYNVLTALGPEEANVLLKKHSAQIDVVVTDQCMQGKLGTEFLKSIKVSHPHIVRILTTSLSDIDTAISAINDSSIFNYIRKPWEPVLLLKTLRGAVEHHRLAAERERLINEKAVIMRHLVASDRLTSYGTLAEGINHHIRNALVPLQSYVQLTSEALEQVEFQNQNADSQFLTTLAAEAKNQLQSIVHILSQLGSLPSPSAVIKRTPVQMEKIWHEILDQFSSALVGKGIFVHLRIASFLPPVKTSESSLRQIMELILMNQISLVPVTGKVTVRLIFKPETAGAPSHIRMEVLNDGPDIPTDRLNSVFTPFFIHGNNPQDTGMHLASCYTSLHSLGGWTHAYNDRVKGTILVFCIPIDIDNPSAFSSPGDVSPLVETTRVPLATEHAA